MNQDRNRQALKMAVRAYGRQMLSDWRLSLAALLLPALGSILVFYIPPLIVAKMLTKFSDGAGNLHDFVPYILWFALIWASGELIWRIAMLFLARAEIRGMNRLYNSGLEALLQKDIDFFNNEFGGSLTKKINRVRPAL